MNNSTAQDELVLASRYARSMRTSARVRVRSMDDLMLHKQAIEAAELVAIEVNYTSGDGAWVSVRPAQSSQDRAKSLVARALVRIGSYR